MTDAQPGPYLVAGSGESLRTVEPARVPASATIVRVNNFFLEPSYLLGRRVDHLYFSADPRAVRFYLATVRRLVARGEYDIRASASHLPAAVGHRPPEPFEAVRHGPEVTELLAEIRAREGLAPTSGLMALLWAYGRGARRMLLAGIDLYAGAKYAFEPPPRLARVLAPNLTVAGHDQRLHSRAADLAVLAWLRERGVQLERTSPSSDALGLPLAPVLPPGEHVVASPKSRTRTDDWVALDGPWSLDALVLARATRRAVEGLRREPRKESA